VSRHDVLDGFTCNEREQMKLKIAGPPTGKGSMLRIGIVGYGVVGRAVASLFRRVHDVCIYDKHQLAFSSFQNAKAINGCNLVFVCVPTPIGRGLAIDESRF
jgi:lactate dehydrogenase-like 2-hydroxyacid dehydrogenase